MRGREGVGSRPLTSPTIPSPSHPLPLEVGPLIQLGVLAKLCKLPSGVLGGAPAETEFGTFSLKI